MFDPIRKLISQNRLRQAFQACEQLQLSASNRSQLIALRRRWDMLTADQIGNTREERLIRIDENQLVQDLLAWLDFMDSDVTDKRHEKAAKTSPPVEPKQKSAFRNIALLLLVVLGLGLGGTYLVRQFGGPDDPAPKERTQNTGDDNRERETTGNEQDSPSRETRDPATGNPSADGPLMSAGPKVKLTVAVYAGRKAPTSYQDLLTKQAARDLSVLQSNSVPTDVLTKAFHSSDVREEFSLRGRIGNPPALNANRADFLLLIDFRDLDRAGKGYLRLFLYDVARKRGFPSGKSFTLEDMDDRGARQIARAAHEYLVAMKERGLFK